MMKTAARILTLLLPVLLLAQAAMAAELTLEEENAIIAAPEPPALPDYFTEQEQLILAAAAGQLTLLDINKPMPLLDGVEEVMGVEYGNAGGVSLKLDLYLPKGNNKPVPGLLFIHGGGWASGKTTDYRYYAMRFAKRGYVVVSITYRFVDKAPFPACVQDAKCAVRWMRANAEKYHVDPDRIAAIGGSAGGHLSMMLGYSADVPELEGDGGHAGFSSAVQAVVDLYGPVDITLPEARDNPTVLRFFGGKTYDEAPEQYRLASPITHLDKNDPPTLIFHGTIDDVVPVAQSDLLEQKLKELGVPVTYDKVKGFPHTMDICQEVNVRCQWFMVRFLDTYLKGKQEK